MTVTIVHTLMHRLRYHSRMAMELLLHTVSYEVTTLPLTLPLLTQWPSNRLVGLVVRPPPRERKIPGSNPACGGIFSGSSHTSDFKIDTPVATLPGAWRYSVSAGTGRPGASITVTG